MSTETPLTDELLANCTPCCGPTPDSVSAEFAKTLERRLASSLIPSEVFAVYGLIMGMLRAEAEAAQWRELGREVTHTPAAGWFKMHSAHPAIQKADEIYRREAKQAGGVQHALSRHTSTQGKEGKLP